MEETKLDNGQTIDQAVESFSGDLGLGVESSPADSSVSLPAGEKAAEADPQGGTQKEAAVVDPNALKPREVPKSWPKEAHEYWGKLDPKVQELVEKREADFHSGIEQYKGDAGFAKAIKEIIGPYQPMLDSIGHTPESAVRGLMNAHYQLSQGDEAARTAFMATLIKGYKIDPAKLAAAVGDGVALTDPALKPLQDQITNLTSQVTSAQKATLDAERTKVNNEVAAFAADPAHPYFEEVASHIVLLLRDPAISLKDAYEQAVRANPVTWAKEETRIRTEIEAKLRKDADDAAAKARKARGTPVRGAESDKSPTDPVGSIEDTMKDTLKDIRNRTAA